jgi:hypothetical protein
MEFFFMTAFLDLLKEKVIVFDGAMGVSLQALNLSIEDWGGPQFENCSENLLYTRPDVVETVHTSFLDIGCDVIETNSFGGSEVVLTEFGIREKTYDVNLRAAELAKRVANDYSTPDRQRFVAGSIGPGTKLPTLGHINYRDLKNAYREQVRGLSLLIDDLFELACIDAGALTLHLQQTHLEDIVETCLRAFDAQARARNVRLESRIDRATPDILAAPDKVERVLLNLLTNALQYRRPEQPVVIRIGAQDQGANETVISVADNGVGIAPDARRMLNTFASMGPD